MSNVGIAAHGGRPYSQCYRGRPNTEQVPAASNQDSDVTAVSFRNGHRRSAVTMLCTWVHDIVLELLQFTMQTTYVRY